MNMFMMSIMIVTYVLMNEILKYSTTNREGYKEYKSNQKICKKCQFLKNVQRVKIRLK